MNDKTEDNIMNRLKTIRQVRAAVIQLEAAVMDIDDTGLQLHVADLLEARSSGFSQWLDQQACKDTQLKPSEHWGAENAAFNTLRGDWG